MVKEVEIYHVEDDGTFPNNKLPLLLYKGAILTEGKAIASEIEKIFLANGWGNAWRNGVYDYHHYHSTTHEVLGIYRGTATIQLGGPAGIKLNVEEGDVVVIPAGVAHKNIGSSNDFKCVGAYPEGCDYDMNYGKPGERPTTDHTIEKVPLPFTDPVYGKEGPLLDHWK